RRQRGCRCGSGLGRRLRCRLPVRGHGQLRNAAGGAARRGLRARPRGTGRRAVSLTERDRKILMLLLPLLLIGGYWFLVLAPQREQAASLGDQVVQAEADRDAAAQQLAA